MRAALALFLLAATPAMPADWVVDPDASVIGLVYSIDGAPADGVFRRVEGEGTFDADAPERTRLELRIAVRSLDLGDPVETGFALSAGWFDAANFPVARYRLAQLTPLGDGRYEALGDLTIKTRTQVLRTPVTLDVAEDAARAEARIVFDRTAFGVGDEVSAIFVDIGRSVTVDIELVARRKGA